MIVTAYLLSIAIASTLRVGYYKKITNLKLFSSLEVKELNIKKFYNFSRPAAGIALLSIAVSMDQTNYSKQYISGCIGQIFCYLSYAGIIFVIFAATQSTLSGII